MPVVHHDNDRAALERLKPAEWRRVRDTDSITHLGYVRALYFGTQTHVDYLCGGSADLESDAAVDGPVDCLVCLSREPDQADVEKLLGSSIKPTPPRIRTAVPRRRSRPSRAR